MFLTISKEGLKFWLKYLCQIKMKEFLLADDHILVRKGIKNLIEEHPFFKCDESSTVGETLLKLKSKTFDLIFLDISFPDGNGIDLLKQIKLFDQKTPICMLSMHPEKEYAIRAFKSGATGYITKESAPDELLKAIDLILKNHRYVSPDCAEILADNLTQSEQKLPHKDLSDREYEVFISIAKGKSLVSISEELFISTKTVSTYRNRVMQKMSFTTNAEIISYALKNNLVS